MVHNIVKTIRIFFIYLRLNFAKGMEYRVNFLTSLFPTFAYSLGYLIFIRTIYGLVPSIAGWTFDQLLALFAIEQFLLYAILILFRQSFDLFSESIRTGEFDLTLKLPISARLGASFVHQEVYIFAPLMGAILIFLYATRDFNLGLVQYLVISFMLCLGIFILYNIYTIIASLSFWTTESAEIMSLGDELMDLGRYPVQIFPQIIVILLLFIFPISLITLNPANISFGIYDWKLPTTLIVMALISFVISQFIWNVGLKRYSSASS